MDRWYWSEASLGNGESSLHTVQGIRLYDGDKKSGYDDGHLVLTNVRFLWRHHSQTKSLVLDLALVVLVEEESGGFTSSPKLVLHLSPCPHSHPNGPVSSSPFTYIKLGFRQGGISSFHQELQNALAARSWERIRNLSLQKNANPTSKQVRTGILGIERAIQAKQNKTDTDINRAFEDLKNLMGFAKEMVSISRNIANKIKEQSGEVSSDETTQFRAYLLSLGIDDPVTKEAIGSTTEYHRKLAQEIARALEKPIKEAGGVMLLTEVYCRINRARGLELLSSEDVYHACCLMAAENLSVKLQTFDSGVQVLQLSTLDQNKIVEETKALLEGHDEHGLSASDVARLSGLPLLLAQERLLEAESCAKAVRDESSEGLRFFPNLFLYEYSW